MSGDEVITFGASIEEVINELSNLGIDESEVFVTIPLAEWKGGRNDERK